MALGENIKSRREELKLSQEYIAEQLGVSRQAISKWETGQSEPTASNLIQLAEILELNLSELVDPQKNNEEPSTSENERHKKEPNLILRANLTKIAIIAHAAILFNCTSVLSLFKISSDGPNSVGFTKLGKSPPPALQRAGRYCMIGKTAKIWRWNGAAGGLCCGANFQNRYRELQSNGL